MPRIGVDYETVKRTAVKLLSQGIVPSVQKIREALGTGSNSTIADHLKMWREEHGKKTIHHLPATMPKELIAAFEVLWQTAMEQAQNQLADYKQSVENECQAALQRERDAERSVVDIKQKLTELSVTLEQEIANNQKLTIELAVLNERLIKQDDAFTVQKNHYEDRLKRVYEEKDSIIMQCHQLQNEIKSLQERNTSQIEQHRDFFAQQNALHEQSESRWVKLVDQAKQEVKDALKKLENLRSASGIEIKKLKATTSDLQQDRYEKNAQLKVNFEQINQLKQDIKILELEIIKAKSTIMKFQEWQQLKNITGNVKNKSKKETLNPKSEVA